MSIARQDIRSSIACAVMGPGLFTEASVDVVCCFQVLDHIFEPKSTPKTCRRVLKPSGVLCLNHNVEALSARLLKDRCPIIDIEHTYLYSPKTMTELFQKSGFQVMEPRIARNRYSVNFLIRLAPPPMAVNGLVQKRLSKAGLARYSWTVPLGNLFMIAQKPL
jgi:hypothetical protein